MGKLKKGDIVARKSYGFDIFFKVVDINDKDPDRVARLKGIGYRIEADALESDLVVQAEQKVREYIAKCFQPVDKKSRERYKSRHKQTHS